MTKNAKQLFSELKINALILTFFLSFFTFQLQATTFTVSNNNDAGPGSLRQAIIDSNADGSATAASRHVIEITVPGAIDINSALDGISNHVTINGHADGSTINNGSNGTFRILFVVGVTVELNRLNITGGKLTTGLHGAGILIGNFSTVTMNHCSFVGNTGATNGGGICSFTGATLTMTNCSLSENQAQFGAGVYNHHGGILTMTNCTVVNNTASHGDGVYNWNVLNITNCIIANNISGDDIRQNGSIPVNVNNIVTTCQGGGGCPSFFSTSDPGLVGVTSCGEIQYQELSSTSIAIDAGVAAGAPTVDICGLPRDANVDIGAHEYGATPAAVPTMGEWALIIFGLIILSMAVVYLMGWQKIKNRVIQSA